MLGALFVSTRQRRKRQPPCPPPTIDPSQITRHHAFLKLPVAWQLGRPQLWIVETKDSQITIREFFKNFCALFGKFFWQRCIQEIFWKKCNHSICVIVYNIINHCFIIWMLLLELSTWIQKFIERSFCHKFYSL